MIELTKANLILYTLGGFEGQDLRDVEAALETDADAKSTVEEARRYNLERLGKEQLSSDDYCQARQLYKLTLYAEGKLDAEERGAIEALLASDSDAREVLAEIRRNIERSTLKEVAFNKWLDQRCPLLNK